MKLSVPASLTSALLALVMVGTAFAQSPHVYVDSQKRFTIQVPAGWAAKPFSAGGGVSGVTVSHGSDAYVQIFLQKDIDPASFLQALNNGVQNGHAGYKISNRGTRTVAGQPRLFIVGESPESATVPRTRMYLETFAANGFSYAIIASISLKTTAGKDSGDYEISQGVIGSLTLNGSPAPPPVAAASAPAPPVRPAPASSPPVVAPTQPPKVVSSTLPAASPSTAPAAVPPATPAARVVVPPTASESATTAAATAPLSPEDQKKLAALDAALKGGAISDEEYQSKKGAVYSSARTKQENTALLKALDQALADGVLTKDEYDRKKKALAGEPSPSPDAAREQAPASELDAPAELKSMEVIVAKAGPPPVPDPLPATWSTDNDPMGFVVSRPSAWILGKVRATGQVVIHGTRGEEVLIWPLRLKQAELDSRGAAAMIGELARKFDVLMPWSPAQSMKNAVRVSGSGSQRSGVAVLSWANNPTGVSIYFYAVEAPQEIYSDSTTAFAAILRSFHVVPDPSVKEILGAPSGSGTEALNFVNWSDPHEGAFTVSVPQGWHAIGGTYRLSSVDVRYGVTMNSADGQIRASIGDSMVGPFTQPSQELTSSGLREGSYQTLADGTRVEILRYLSGQQFARSYVETLVSRQCSSPQIAFNNRREDLASTFSQSAARAGFRDALLTAGDVSFNCTMDGRPVKGRYIAATIRLSPNASPLWFVYRLYGYIAFSGREQEGEKVLMQMVQSWKFTPEWEALQKDAAIPVVQPETDSSQQIRERAQQAIIDDQRQIGEMNGRSVEQRQKIYDQIDRKRQASALGSIDIVDPETGVPYKLIDFADYRYLGGDGYIYSENSQFQSNQALKQLLDTL